MNVTSYVRVAFALFLTGCATVSPPEPYGTLPSPQQVEWQKMEMNILAHFGPNTFTGLEWGLGTEAEDIFNPTALDCRQWTSIAKAAGFKGIVITGKHHDGFCLWPNPLSAHTVANSPWKEGKGDVLKELSEACAQDGLKFGVYVSPWDRNDPHYGTPEYNDVFAKTLENIYDGRYGTIYEQWFDQANGEGPNGKKQEYDWYLFRGTVFKYQPQTIIMFSNMGPGCRWVGNERGVAGKTNWSTFNSKTLIRGEKPGVSAIPKDTLRAGNVHGNTWQPGEADVSIRPGWFWKESENDRVKSLKKLLSIYYTSVGRNSLLLLGVPPDDRGLFHPADSARLMEFRAALDTIFKDNLSEGAKVSASGYRGRGYKASNVLNGDYDSYWAAPDGDNEATLTLDLGGQKTFNRILLQEYIPLGQRVKAFTVEVCDSEGQWKQIASETTIGYKRIVPTKEVTASKVRIHFSSYAPALINTIGLYLDTISGYTEK